MPPPVPSPGALRSLYRSLLRELPIPPSAAASPTTPNSRSSPTSTSKSPTATKTTVHNYIRSSLSSHQSAQSARSPNSTQSSQPPTPSPSPSISISSTTPTSFPLATQILQYVRAQRRYATLLEKYNPGLAEEVMGVDPGERVRLTAKRVGMVLPTRGEGLT